MYLTVPKGTQHPLQKMSYTIEQIAKVCHDTNKSFCESTGDATQKSWEEAEEWQKQSARLGVDFAIQNPDAQASAQHDAWCADKWSDGWIYGPEKNAEIKQHPCLVPYHALPLDQRIKDHLFKAVVTSMLVTE